MIHDGASLQPRNVMFGSFIILLCVFIPVSHSEQFAKELWELNISESFNGRVAEHIVVPRHMRNIAYISFSEERHTNATSTSEDTTRGEEHIAANPLVVKVLAGRELVIKWSTPLNQFVGNTRFTRLSLAPNETELFVIGTLMNNETESKLYVQSIDTENGKVNDVFVISELSGSHVITNTAVDMTGIYICGRTTNTSENLGVNIVESWELLLGKISFYGSVIWRHTKNIENTTCEGIDLSGGYVYTSGITRNGLGIDSGVLYKHSTSGSAAWGKRVRSTAGLSLRPAAIVAHEDGIFVSSNFVASTEPRERALIQKVSPLGTLLWSRRIGEASNGYPVGLGFHHGHVYSFVVGDGVTLASVSKFGDVDEVALDIREVGTVGWGDKTSVVAGTQRLHAIGITGEGVTDSREGRYAYTIAATLRLDDSAIHAVADYMSEITRGGAATARAEGGRTVVTVVVRGEIAELEQLAGRVRKALETSDQGRSALERDLGAVVGVGGVTVARGIRGKGASPAVVVAVVLGTGVVVAVVSSWFCVTNAVTAVGERTFG